MQIVTNTYDRLILRSRNSVFAGIAWGSAVILLLGVWTRWPTLDQGAIWGMSLTALVFFCLAIYLLRPSILDFDRSANRFRWTRPGLFRSVRDEVSLDSIKRVRVDTINSDGDDAHNVVVETRNGTVPLQHMYWGGDARDHQSVVDLIRAWLGG